MATLAREHRCGDQRLRSGGGRTVIACEEALEPEAPLTDMAAIPEGQQSPGHPQRRLPRGRYLRPIEGGAEVVVLCLQSADPQRVALRVWFRLLGEHQVELRVPAAQR